MPKINTIQLDATPSLDDKVLGTAVDDGAATRNFLIRDIVSLENGQPGWARYDDTVYTSSNKLSLSNGNEVVIPNNAGNVVRSPEAYDFYNSSTQKILGLAENDTYMFTFVFKASSPNTNQTHLEWRLVGDGDISRVGGSIGYFKGNNVEQNEHVVCQYYTDADFVANGVEARITSIGNSSSMWDIIFFIQRVQKGQS